MIPKYVYDKQQTELNTENISIKDRLLNHRKLLYYDFINQLKILNVQKITLINNFKISIKEIDLEIQQEEYKQSYILQSLKTRR